MIKDPVSRNFPARPTLESLAPVSAMQKVNARSRGEIERGHFGRSVCVCTQRKRPLLQQAGAKQDLCPQWPKAELCKPKYHDDKMGRMSALRFRCECWARVFVLLPILRWLTKGPARVHPIGALFGYPPRSGSSFKGLRLSFCSAHENRLKDDAHLFCQDLAHKIFASPQGETAGQLGVLSERHLRTVRRSAGRCSFNRQAQPLAIKPISPEASETL